MFVSYILGHCCLTHIMLIIVISSWWIENSYLKVCSSRTAISTKIHIRVIQRNTTNKRVYRLKNFIIRNWLSLLWWLESKSAVWAGRLKTQQSWCCCSGPEAGRLETQDNWWLNWSLKAIYCRILSYSGADWSFYVKAFNWLDVVHPHYRGQSAALYCTLFYWLKC